MHMLLPNETESCGKRYHRAKSASKFVETYEEQAANSPLLIIKHAFDLSNKAKHGA